MKVHPILAIIIGLFLFFFMSFSSLLIGNVGIIIALFLSGSISAMISKNNQIIVGLSIGLIVSVGIFISATLQGVNLSDTWELITMPLITGFMGWVVSKYY